MALENRIDSLKKQHARLEQLLHAEETHPSADEGSIYQIKLRKLAIKDEIEQLLHGSRIAA